MAAAATVKTVTFKLPGDGGGASGSRTGTPERNYSPSRSRGQSPLKTTPQSQSVSLDSPPQAKVQQVCTRPTVLSPPPHHPSSPLEFMITSKPQPFCSEQAEAKEEVSSGAKRSSQAVSGRPVSRPGSEMKEILRQQEVRTGKAGRGGIEGAAARDRSPLLFDRQSRMTASQVSQVASQLRERANTSSHDRVRSLKFEVARLREHLLKAEEEVKHLSRGRRTLELAVEDIRRAISVNQQSHSSQLKKSRGDGVGLVVGPLKYLVLLNYEMKAKYTINHDKNKTKETKSPNCNARAF